MRIRFEFSNVYDFQKFQTSISVFLIIVYYIISDRNASLYKSENFECACARVEHFSRVS
jgi:hypothetical protein